MKNNSIMNLNVDLIKQDISETEKDILYIAGNLFSYACQQQRIKEEKYLRANAPLSVFNPLTCNKGNDKVSTLATAIDIFSVDTEKIIASKYLLAELDGEDAGVMAELGFLSAINFFKKCLEIMGEEDFIDFLNSIPKKQIVAHYSDLRIPSAHKYGVPTCGLNHYVLGLVEASDGVVLSSPQEAMDYIVSMDANEIKEYNFLDGFPLDSAKEVE